MYKSKRRNIDLPNALEIVSMGLNGMLILECHKKCYNTYILIFLMLLPEMVKLVRWVKDNLIVTFPGISLF